MKRFAWKTGDLHPLFTDFAEPCPKKIFRYSSAPASDSRRGHFRALAGSLD
jgi:hypothetical protein